LILLDLFLLLSNILISWSTQTTEHYNNMHVLLFGQGKMARAMEVACTYRGIRLTKFGMDFDHSNPNYGKPVAVHFGSGKQLTEAIELCEKLKMPLIQGTTKVEVPKGRKAVIFNIPNLSLPIIRFLGAFPAFKAEVGKGMRVSIVESHPEQKADVSGTAKIAAVTSGIDEKMIKSVRDVDVQLAMGVEREHLKGHAYHDFIFIDEDFPEDNVEIKIRVKVHGYNTYARGAIALGQAIIAQPKPLEDGIYGLENVRRMLLNK
jgi:dihydrodipicolinate reductase